MLSSEPERKQLLITAGDQHVHACLRLLGAFHAPTDFPARENPKAGFGWGGVHLHQCLTAQEQMHSSQYRGWLLSRRGRHIH